MVANEVVKQQKTAIGLGTRELTTLISWRRVTGTKKNMIQNELRMTFDPTSTPLCLGRSQV